MLKKLIFRLLKHRHFWREASFDELSEIYVSMMSRSLAMSLVGIFVPVFLLTSGFNFTELALFFIWFFAARVMADIVGGYLVARFGPKHVMLASYFTHILAMCFFVTLPQQDWPLMVPGMLWGAANSLFYLSFHVDFSKVKHSEHGGKELGYVTIMERIGGTIGPVLGGLLAAFFGAQYIFIIAIFLLLLGIVPLFSTAEPVQLKQHLDFKGFKLDDMKRDLFSYAFFQLEANLCLALWPAFLTLFVLTTNTYATIGLLASIGFVVSVTGAYAVGKLIDEHKGRSLMRFSAVGNSLVHLLRPVVNSVPFALCINVSNELLTVGYRLPFYKGVYDAADAHPGHRIVYLVTMEAVGSYTKLIAWIILFMASMTLSNYQTLVVGFGLAGLASLLILAERFPALKPRQHIIKP